MRELCSNPDSVIVLVDLDDALGACDALATVQASYRAGADVTVGTMVRTDKEASYPVDFTDPRRRRGGNVWQHLRTFRKGLFDRIELADLRLDGTWIELANDWAIMIPIVELATNPAWIRRPLYLHEPSGPRTAEARSVRESVIARTLARPSYRSSARSARLRPHTLTVLCYHRIADRDAGIPELYWQRGMVVSRRAFEAHVRSIARRFEPVDLRDLSAAARNERSLPERPVLVTFDDGYRDLVDAALPRLEGAGIPAVVFARVPGPDGLPSLAPLDLLCHVLATPRGAPPPLSPEARDALLRAPHAQQIERVLDLAIKGGGDALSLRRSALYLDAAALREAQGGGVAIGAHGVDHVRWTTLSDSILERAAMESASWLRAFAPGLPLALAYPDAAYDDREASAAQQAGFTLGFGLDARPPGVPDPLGIRRRIAQDDPRWIDLIADSLETEAR